MAENTDIAWAHHTFNPWIGCTKVSAACDNCYAEDMDKRWWGGKAWGPHAPRRRTKTWNDPLKWSREAAALDTIYRVFCASLADVFDNHKSIEQEWRDDLWELIRLTPCLRWMLLTKRPQNIFDMLPGDWGRGYPNVALGTTVENQEEANRRIRPLLSVPARLHFLSMEPLLDFVNLHACTFEIYGVQTTVNAFTGRNRQGHQVTLGTIGHVISGGESGRNYRKVGLDVHRSIRDQCAGARVPYLFKQHEGPSQQKIKAMGRELDGVVHDAYPRELTE